MDTTQIPTNSSDQGSKKALLQKLMSNLLGKPGRSMHEIINGVKEAISAYRNYAKEWDTLNGVTEGAAKGAAIGATAGAVGGATKNSIQDIMAQIQQQKAGGVQKSAIAPIPPMPAKPEMTPLPQMRPAVPPQEVPPVQPQDIIAGQPQTSTFNRPAPVSNLGIHGF